MKKQLFFYSILGGLLFLLIGAYLDRPTVEISSETGACVRAYGPDGLIPCDKALAGAHDEVPV